MPMLQRSGQSLRLCWRPFAGWRSLCSSSSSSSSSQSEVSLEYQDGLPRFRLPLPSRGRTCQFTLRPLSDTVRDIVGNIKEEDRGLDQVIFYSADGVRIASSDSVDSLLRADFELQLNDRRFAVRAPGASADESGEGSLEEAKNVISQLYTTLHVQEYQVSKERQLREQLQLLQAELEPLEKNRLSLADKAAKRTRYLTWGSLSFMGLQFGFLARLTWWEYSWDIMEPVTYFVGYGTALLCYAYYVITKQEYTFPQVWDREYLKKFYNDADKTSFDVVKYNQLRDHISQVESDLQRLRDPLLLQLPLQQRQQQQP